LTVTNPTTPEGVITRSAQRISAARDATRALAAEVQAKRAAAAADQAPAVDSQGGAA
jgi:hypothetical protein